MDDGGSIPFRSKHLMKPQEVPEVTPFLRELLQDVSVSKIVRDPLTAAKLSDAGVSTYSQLQQWLHDEHRKKVKGMNEASLGQAAKALESFHSTLDSELSSARTTPLLLVALIAGVASVAAALIQYLPRERPVSSAPPDYRISAGDILGIYIEGVLGRSEDPVPLIFGDRERGLMPFMGYPVLVEGDGAIWLPLVPPITVSGKSLREIREMVRNEYTENRRILPPERARIIVTLAYIRPPTRIGIFRTAMTVVGVSLLAIGGIVFRRVRLDAAKDYVGHLIAFISLVAGLIIIGSMWLPEL